MKTVKEEHISFVQEPYSLFIGHKAVESSKAGSIVAAIIETLIEKKINPDDINGVGSDGTNVNTGETGGVIVKLEMEWNRPLQWNICLIHANELPLRALITKFDGGTKGPHTYSGSIGKRLTDCLERPVVEFDPIPFLCPRNLEEISETLNSDQKYLFDICIAISEGNVSKELAERSPGPLAMARWVTTGNRILRLYVSDPAPSTNLKTLARYIMTVYAPMIFEIKHKSSIVYGPIH